MLDVMVVELAVPFRWDRAVLNAGERVDLPQALALRLVEAGQAHEPRPVTQAMEGPPADKRQRRQYFKSSKAVQ